MVDINDDSVISNYTNQRLGNYRLLHLLGRGGYASVYLGEHMYLKRLAAVKVLRTMLDAQEKGRFLDEARLLAGLSHPHIVRVLEFDVLQNTTKDQKNQIEKSIPFLIMDFVPGGSLRACYPTGSCLFLDTVVDYIKQVAVPLQYAHDRGIIHRDIKPENLLLNERQEIVLSDFGLALFAPTPELLSLQEMAGSLPYSAPEQLRGKPHFASDQYSLGIIAYEWLCGQRPFRGKDVEIMMQHLSSPPPSLHRQKPGVPAAVEEVIFTTLEKDPQRRYSSVQEFARELEHASKWNIHHFSNYAHPAIREPSSNPKEKADTNEPSFLGSDFEPVESNEEIWSDDTKEIIAVNPFAEKQPSGFKRSANRSPKKKWKKTGLSIGILLVLLIGITIGSYSVITIRSHTKTIKAIPLAPVGHIDFSTYPAQVQHLTVVENNSMSINGLSIMGPNQQVVVTYTPIITPKHTLTITVRGLVSRINNITAGYAPISLLCNGQSIVNDFTTPGNGFNPNTSSFQVPIGFAKHENNQFTLKVSSKAKTYFWIYELSVSQNPPY